jgi:gliding motility-associated-like protein
MRTLIRFPFLSVAWLTAQTVSLLPAGCAAQALFDTPDTVCVGELIDIQNLTTGGNTFYWSFCSGNVNRDPVGMNIGNPGLTLNIPTYLTLVRDGASHFTFITCQGWPGLVRIYHGSSFVNDPVSSDTLGNFGILNDSVEGVQILRDNGNWYGFLANSGAFVRLNFGNSLWNTPVASQMAPSGLEMLHCLEILRDGPDWIGFCSSSIGNCLYRLNFGTSLGNDPVVENLGNPAFFDQPGQFSLVLENGNWYMILLNRGSFTLSRISFGSSLLNIPVGENLGLVQGLSEAGGMEVIRDCEVVTGYATRYVEEGELVKLVFDGGITGFVSGSSLGNIGQLKRPNNISEIVRVGDTLFAYLSNRGLEYLGSYSLTRLIFPPCTNATTPSSTLFDPPVYSYNQPGTYTVRLLVDEGTPYQTSFCRTITVLDIQAGLGPDISICQGDSAGLSPGSGFSSYTWSTGDTTPAITVRNAGKYWVTVTNDECSSTDSVTVTVFPVTLMETDTIICFGDSIFLQGSWQSVPAAYADTSVSIHGCDSIRVTNLSVRPQIPLSLGSDSILCTGDQVWLDPAIPGASCQWQDGSTGTDFLVTEPGKYWVTVMVGNCTETDTVLFQPCTAKVWFPTAFTPNGDGINDSWQPVGTGVTEFQAVIFDRWGTQLFEIRSLQEGWDGRYQGRSCVTGTYGFRAVYRGSEGTEQETTVSGTFSLLK